MTVWLLLLGVSVTVTGFPLAGVMVTSARFTPAGTPAGSNSRENGLRGTSGVEVGKLIANVTEASLSCDAGGCSPHPTRRANTTERASKINFLIIASLFTFWFNKR